MRGLAFLHPLRPIRRRHIALLRQVASIEHRVLDQSTALGYVWSFLNPLLMLLVLWAFYGRRTSANIPHFAVYLLIGLVQYNHFSRNVSSGMRVLYRTRSLATSVIFPKDVLIYSTLLAGLPEFLISVALTIIIALVSGVSPSWALLAVPLVLATQFLLVLWISLLLSMMYVFVRDLDQLFEMGMRLLFFMTPLMYSLDTLSRNLRNIALLNPLTHVIGYTRTIVLEGRFPAMGQLIAFMAVNIALSYGALMIFRHAEPALLERL